MFFIIFHYYDNVMQILFFANAISAIICYMIHRSSYLKFGGPDPAWPRAPKSGGSADPADPVLPTPLLLRITLRHSDTHVGLYNTRWSAAPVHVVLSCVFPSVTLTTMQIIIKHFWPRHFDHHILSTAFCPRHFVQWHFVPITFCPRHFVRDILSGDILS